MVNILSFDAALAVALTSSQLLRVVVVNALLYYLLVNEFLHVYLYKAKWCVVGEVAKILELVHLGRHALEQEQVVFYFFNRRLNFQGVLAVVLVELLVKNLCVNWVQKQVFTSAALVEVVEVLVVFFNILLGHFSLFFLLGLLRISLVQSVGILVGLRILLGQAWHAFVLH